MIEVVAFTGTLTHTCKHRIARVHFCDVVDQLHDQNGFTDTGPPEQTNFTTLGIGGQQIDNLDAGHQNF